MTRHAVIALKSYVRGHFFKRNGKLFYVRPYENNKGRKSSNNQSSIVLKKVAPVLKKERLSHLDDGNHPSHFINVDGYSINKDVDFIIQFALRTAEKINTFEDAEKSRLRNVLKYCRAILVYYKYMDTHISHLFRSPDVEPEPLSPAHSRQMRGVRKEGSDILLRVNNAKVKHYVREIVDSIRDKL